MHHTPLKHITDKLRTAYPLICPKCNAAYAKSEREAYNAHRQICKAK